MTRDLSLLSIALVQTLFSELNVSHHGAYLQEGQAGNFHHCKNATRKLHCEKYIVSHNEESEGY